MTIFSKTQKLCGLTAVFRNFSFKNKISDIFKWTVEIEETKQNILK
jgi:hypothetical protein